MTAETTRPRTEQREDHVRASDQQLPRNPRGGTAVQADGRWYPSGEAVGGAIAGGIAGSFAFGPLGALVGMFVGAALAVATTRYFTQQTR
jgi:hypothetical protein